MTETDFDITNSTYHKAESLGLELVAPVIISNLSIDSKEPLYYSYLEHNMVAFVKQDITYKTVNESRDELDREKDDAVHDAVKQEKIEIAKKCCLKIKTLMRLLNLQGLQLKR